MQSLRTYFNKNNISMQSLFVISFGKKSKNKRFITGKREQRQMQALNIYFRVSVLSFTGDLA